LGAYPVDVCVIQRSINLVQNEEWSRFEAEIAQVGGEEQGDKVKEGGNSQN
jgi:hypothetical protein